MSELPMIFRAFQIIIPTFAVIVFCTAFWKCLLQSRRRRREQRQQAEASARAPTAPSSVYIIPFSPAEEEDHRPTSYSQEQHYTAPPPYNELVMKPDYPLDPPPAYTEFISPPIISSDSDRTVPSCPALPE